MADFLNDPRFPDRPNHPDFWRMVDGVLRLDGESDEHTFTEIVSPIVDVDSVLYLATQRVLRGRGDGSIAPVWIDGFLVGVLYQQEGGHRDGE